MKNPDRSEFTRFDALMKRLVQVPHSTIKAKLDAEKAAKAKNTKRKGKPKRND